MATLRTTPQHRARIAGGFLGCALVGLAISVLAHAEPDAERNGFALAPALIPAEEILPGGPPRDGIPALDAPEVAGAEAAGWQDTDRIVGVAIGDRARAYPIALLEWHELVNDTLGDVPILVSFCPLCDSALVFDRRIDGKANRFGVSGLLHNSDLLMFDRETESLWSQILAQAVTGERMGLRLRILRSRVVTWGAWKHAHPNTTVLTRRTGHRRPYGKSPYGDYRHSRRLLFPAPEDQRLHPKAAVVGLRSGDASPRAYSADAVMDAGGRVVEDFDGHRVEIRYEHTTRSFQVTAPPEVEVVEAFWFAWAAFHPETSLYEARSTP